MLVRSWVSMPQDGERYSLASFEKRAREWRNKYFESTLGTKVGLGRSGHKLSRPRSKKPYFLSIANQRLNLDKSSLYVC